MCPKGKEQHSNSAPPSTDAAAPGMAQVPASGQWTTGLCGCCEDPINCIITWSCPCVPFGQNAGILHNSPASCGWAGLFYALLAPLCLVSCYGCAYRAQLRGKCTLPGDPCWDFMAHLFCPCCAISQEYRELKNRGFYDPPDKRGKWRQVTPPWDSKGLTWQPKPSHPDGLSPTTFTYEELAMATNDFADANLLGKGGFGYVHKGVLANGRVVAVKQLRSGSSQGEREFRTEIDIIGRVHHRNLVSLVGYCTTESQRMLVYEFVPNHDLEFHLHGRGKAAMDWSTRTRVALGAAKGLTYLHEHCRPKIIHRDIKASNILIDDNFEAKVADFGLAKYSLDTDTHVSTRVMGTFGYLAPEYASTGKLTDKSDVYSFGVVLLELITGHRPVDRNPSSKEYYHESIVDRCRPLLKQALEGANYNGLVDPKLLKDYDLGEMTRMIACASACVRHSARLRPRMTQIVRALEGNLSLDELNEGTVAGYSQYQEGFEIFQEMTMLDSQDFSSSSTQERSSQVASTASKQAPSSSTDVTSELKTTRDSFES